MCRAPVALASTPTPCVAVGCRRAKMRRRRRTVSATSASRATPALTNASTTSEPPGGSDQNTLLLTAAAVGISAGIAVGGFNAVEKDLHNVVFGSCVTWCDGAAPFVDTDPMTTLGNAIGTLFVPTFGGMVVSGLRFASGGFVGEPNPRMDGKVKDGASTSDEAANANDNGSMDFGWSTDGYSGIDLSDLEESERAMTAMTTTSGDSVPVGAKVLAKTCAAAVTLGAGCSLGPEGPSVELGAAVAERVGVAFPTAAPSRLGLLAAGAAAGFSAGFGAPIAGLFFGFESILVPGSKGGASTGALTTEMVILASVLSTVATTVVFGTSPGVDVPPFELVDLVELPLYLPLGVACGVTAAALRKMNVAFDEFAENIVAAPKEEGGIGLPRVWHAPIGGFLLGCLALKFPQVTYQGFDNVNSLLSRNATQTFSPLLLSELVLAKLVATAICRGSGLVGGVYAPSLFLGAALGTGFGGVLEMIDFPAPFAAPPQAYALVAMAGVLGGVCRVPLTAILLLFELTGDYRIILPLMGTVTLATSIVNSVEDAATAAQSSANDIETQGVAALASSLISRPRDVMRTDVVAISEDATLQTASDVLLSVTDSENPPPCVFVMSSVDGAYAGVVTPRAIAEALENGTLVLEDRVAGITESVPIVDADVKLRDFQIPADASFMVVVNSSQQSVGVVETTAVQKQISREHLRSALSGKSM
jgi:H+/Cl- antiporter ClcA/predicted transcriptional regulator